MDDDPWDGVERRQPVSGSKKTAVDWLPVILPIATVLVAVAVSWGGFDTRLDRIDDELSRLVDLPIQMTKIAATLEHLDETEQIRLTSYENRLTTAEDRVKNLAARVRDLEQAMPRSATH